MLLHVVTSTVYLARHSQCTYNLCLQGVYVSIQHQEIKLKDDKAEWYNYDEGGSNKLKAMGWQQESDRTIKQMQDQLKGRKKAVFYTSRCVFKDSKLISSMAHS